ncbi:hypothetical protein JQC92_12400 [Shewanella sp. 202IG2-18]|uniref:tetratricopeptide repeat protein n=1 Tax=Parashewanella hymeniacidonis TaxID=2807618 RepID=UPI001961A1EE|nr:tetratricopeptide repeat protein [Parashewanella hymeniacidonis]MBM7072823.1 hypothetical protein [Parashewanella hymeniacidonis]
MPFFIISLIIQVALVVHIVKTGRNTMWIWLVIMLPLAGAIAYFIIEVLPSLTATRTARKASRGMGSFFNPNKSFNQATKELAVSDTVEHRMHLAEEYLEKLEYQKAKDLYEKSLVGIHEDDPDLMYGLARSEYGLKNYKHTKQILDDLIKQNPKYKNQEAHLLYAQSNEQLGKENEALEEYKVLSEYYSGAEAKYCYGKLLQKQGDKAQAKLLFKEIIEYSKLSTRHYRDLNKKWILLAKQEL